jgi:formamidopyrimidine-DNA glycosylase
MLILNVESDLDIAVHFKMSGQLVLVRTQNSMARTQKKDTKRVGGPVSNVGLRIAGGHPTLRQSSGQADIKNRIVGGHPTTDWTGQLPSKHTRAVFHLANGDKLYFNDQRIFGWVKILPDKEIEKLAFLQKLGPEPWDISDEKFHQLITSRKKAIKLVVMDQEILSGVGNIYANDGLWEARIHPQRIAAKLSNKETAELRGALIKVLKEGIKYGGATASDAKYINLDGMGGKYQEHFRSYDRESDPCPRCKIAIKKIKMGGRGTYFCPNCQKQ